MQQLTAKDGQSKDILAENVARLKELFPEAFAEGRIDFEALKNLLGEHVEDRDERYSFTWNGKSRSIRLAQAPSTGTLRPAPEESLNWDSTGNLFIEGDNLEVLKLLQKSYHKTVKMIYIDPPYNTGGEFIYRDDYRDNLDNYLKVTGQVDGSGHKYSTNTETSGRYHTDWLNMMYPRLKLARNLLRDDGVIFISIDDHEVANLRKICDEIFGEENHISLFPWRSRTAKADVPFGISVDIEWIIAYAKPKFIAGRYGKRKYYKSDDYEDRWRLQDCTKNTTKEERPNSYFTMVNPRNGESYPPSDTRTWSVTKDTFNSYYEAGKIVFPGDYDFLNIKRPAFRVFEKEDKEKALQKYGTEELKMSISTHLPEKVVGRTEHGSKEIRDLFGQQIFSYPKPSKLIKYFIESIGDDEAIVMDFFAGSSPTAQAVLDLNQEDLGNRKFIMIQLPEPCSENTEAWKAGYSTIAEIGKERIRRVSSTISENNPEYDGDLGFKVFKLDSSNIKPWDVNRDNLETRMLDLMENIKPERSELDVLYELLLKYGLDLTIPMEKRLIQDKQVFIIDGGKLVVCLDMDITLELVEAVAELKQELQPESMRVVFRDLGFPDDVVKTNAVQILRQHGVQDVRSL